MEKAEQYTYRSPFQWGHFRDYIHNIHRNIESTEKGPRWLLRALNECTKMTQVMTGTKYV